MNPFAKDKKAIWKGITATELWDASTVSLQGNRPSMEDTHMVKIGGGPDCTPFLLAGICDGHGGADCSRFLIEEIPNGFLSAVTTQAPAQAFHDTYLEVDKKILAKEDITDGSTALFVYIVDNQLTIAHTGDCRALLSVKGKGIQLTEDHHPTNAKEAERIAAAGGSIVNGYVCGKVAVTRSFGDREVKNLQCFNEGPVICTPQMITRTLTEDVDFLVISCDGLFEEMESDEVCQFVYGKKDLPASEIATQLGREAIELGSEDNVSLTVIKFDKKWKKIIEKNFKNSKPEVSLNRSVALPASMSNPSKDKDDKDKDKDNKRDITKSEKRDGWGFLTPKTKEKEPKDKDAKSDIKMNVSGAVPRTPDEPKKDKKDGKDTKDSTTKDKPDPKKDSGTLRR